MPLATAPSTPGYQGYYIGGSLLVLAPGGGYAEATWMDSRTGRDQTEVGIVSLR
jgi:hypothetical protein